MPFRCPNRRPKVVETCYQRCVRSPAAQLWLPLLGPRATVPVMNLRWILGLSVAMNAVLLVALQLQRTEPARPSSLSPTATASPPEFSRSAGDPGSTMSSGEKIERKKARAATARQSLETDDYPLFVKKLRAAGLSEDTIATLL